MIVETMCGIPRVSLWLTELVAVYSLQKIISGCNPHGIFECLGKMLLAGKAKFRGDFRHGGTGIAAFIINGLADTDECYIA